MAGCTTLGDQSREGADLGSQGREPRERKMDTGTLDKFIGRGKEWWQEAEAVLFFQRRVGLVHAGLHPGNDFRMFVCQVF